MHGSHDSIHILIEQIYFSLTTLATVGFGDIHPQTEYECLFCILIFVMGVSIFSIILGNFTQIIVNISSLQADHEEDDMLSCFIGCLEKFNNRQPINEEFTQRLRTFFYYKWKHDKNICL